MPSPSLVVFRGPWAEHAYYYPGDAVTASGVAYVCTRPHRAQSAPASDSDHWLALGVLLGEGGTFPAPDLPATIAYTDASNTFTQPQTITDPTDNGLTVQDGSGLVSLVQPGEVFVGDGTNNAIVYPTQVIVNGPNNTRLQLNNTLTPINTDIVAEASGLTLAEGAVLGPPWAYQVDGPASAIHLDQDGTMHLQVAESGTTGDPITWADAVVINNDGTITIAGDIAAGGLTVTYPADGNVAVVSVENTFGFVTTASSGTTFGNRFGLEANQSGTAGYCVLSIEGTETTLGSGTHLLWQGVTNVGDVQTTVATLDSAGNLHITGDLTVDGSVPAAAPSTPAAVRARDTSGFQLVAAPGTDLAVAWNTTDLDQGTSPAQHSTSVQPSRLTCRKTGLYQITTWVRVQGGSAGIPPASHNSLVKLRLNSDPDIGGETSVNDGDSLEDWTTVTTLYPLTAGDYVETIVSTGDPAGALVEAKAFMMHAVA